MSASNKLFSGLQTDELRTKVKTAGNNGLMKWLGLCLAARVIDFLNYCMSRQKLVVASISATSLTHGTLCAIVKLMLSLELFDARMNRYRIYEVIIFGLFILTFRWIFPTIILTYYLLFFMLFLFYLSITERLRQPIGTVLLDYNTILLKKGKEELEINLSDGWKVELSYSGYRNKRMIGDFIPRYNSNSGIDNYLILVKENQRIKYRILVNNENQENVLLELVSFWENQKYKVVFNRKFRVASRS